MDNDQDTSSKFAPVEVVHSRRRFFQSKLAKVIIILVVGLAAFGIAAAIFLQLQPTVSEEPVDDGETSVSQQELDKAEKVLKLNQDISNKSYQMVEEEGYEATSDWYQEKVDAASSEDKVTYYLQWGVTAYNNNKFDEALKYAQAAEDLEHSGITAGFVAHCAYAAGNKEIALKYYKLALERRTNWEAADDVKDTYEERVRELSQ